MTAKTGIQRAVELAAQRSPDHTGLDMLARQLGVTIQAVSQWTLRGWVPPARAAEIHDFYGVPVVDLVKPELRELFAAHAGG